MTLRFLAVVSEGMAVSFKEMAGVGGAAEIIICSKYMG